MVCLLSIIYARSEIKMTYAVQSGARGIENTRLKSIRPNGKIIKRGGGRLVAKLIGTTHKNHFQPETSDINCILITSLSGGGPGETSVRNDSLVRENFVTTDPDGKLLPTSDCAQ